MTAVLVVSRLIGPGAAAIVRARPEGEGVRPPVTPSVWFAPVRGPEEVRPSRKRQRRLSAQTFAYPYACPPTDRSLSRSPPRTLVECDTAGAEIAVGCQRDTVCPTCGSAVPPDPVLLPGRRRLARSDRAPARPARSPQAIEFTFGTPYTVHRLDRGMVEQAHPIALIGAQTFRRSIRLCKEWSTRSRSSFRPVGCSRCLPCQEGADERPLRGRIGTRPQARRTRAPACRLTSFGDRSASQRALVRESSRARVDCRHGKDRIGNKRAPGMCSRVRSRSAGGTRDTTVRATVPPRDRNIAEALRPDRSLRGGSALQGGGARDAMDRHRPRPSLP